MNKAYLQLKLPSSLPEQVSEGGALPKSWNKINMSGHN